MDIYTETSKSIKDLSLNSSTLFEIYTLNILQSFGYYTLTFLLPIYYSTQFNLSDIQAGSIFALSGISLGVLSLLGGKFIPYIGCKRGLNLATFSGFLGFLLLSMNVKFELNVFAMVFLVCLGNGLAWPAIGMEVKRYSEVKNRSTSNSIMMMGNYLAGIIAGTYIDIVWNYFDDYKIIFEIIYSTAAAALGLSFLISLTLKPSDIPDSDSLISPESNLFSKKFCKFLMVILLITLFHSVCFEQLDATFPKYMMRTVNSKAHFGIFLAIHSANMMIGALLFTPLTYMLSSYNLILLGCFFGCLACFCLSLGSTNIHYVIFVLLLSTGESILVPRTIDYTMKISHQGSEGVYLAICHSPYYFGMILTGMVSGKLLEMYCPIGQSYCLDLWQQISMGSFIIFLLLLLLKWCLNDE